MTQKDSHIKKNEFEENIVIDCSGYSEVSKFYTGIVITPAGLSSFKNGVGHNDHGPAVLDYDGTKKWMINGLYHREDGPAIEYPDGTELWYRNDQLHREDGPAWILNGKKHWCLYGNFLTAEEHFEEVFAQASTEKQSWMLFNLDIWVDELEESIKL